jgi:pimeloyl-ACP methyl ester carboxylesterase
VPGARAEALLRMDPGVLESAADRSTLAGTDTTSPVTVPVLVLAADDAMGAAFPTRHAERLAITHPEVEVIRVAGAAHGIHDQRDRRADYVEQLARFLERQAPPAG